MEVLILIQAVYQLYMLYIDRDMRLEVLIFVPGLQQVPSRSIQAIQANRSTYLKHEAIPVTDV